MMDRDVEIDSLVHLCGCQGKPPSERVMKPALEQAKERLSTENIKFTGDSDVGTFELREGLRRELEVVSGDISKEKSPIDGSCSNILNVSYIDTVTGNKSDKLSNYLCASYKQLRSQNSVKIQKGHSVLVEGLSSPFHVNEYLWTEGDRKPGWVAANIDVIHALPKLSPEEQSAVAISNTLNDCYTVGAHRHQAIRPLIAHNSDFEVPKSEVRNWYGCGASADASILDPCVIRHDGRGWLFGATATAVTHRQPPRFVNKLSAGDLVLMHRPIGGLAAFTAKIDDGELDEGIVEMLLHDHGYLAETIESYCPEPDMSFDSKRHLKLATDVSGPGIRGILDYLSNVDVKLTNLPFVEPGLIRDAQRKWMLPDATIETNGPLLLIGSPTVIQSIQSELLSEGEIDPHIIGSLIPGTGRLRSTDGLELDRFIETMGREDRP